MGNDLGMSDGNSFSPATLATARALLGQYGEDAEVIAMLRAAELAAEGDHAGLADWDAIIACILALEAGEASAGPLQ
jgi:hypothetical protein